MNIDEIGQQHRFKDLSVYRRINVITIPLESFINAWKMNWLNYATNVVIKAMSYLKIYYHILLICSFITVNSIVHSSSVHPVKIKEALRDTETVVGQLFTYSVADGFQGDVQYLTVSEAGAEKLPNWLVWEDESSSFIGVPTEHDVGMHHVQVVAHALNETHSSTTRQVFTINVKHEGSLVGEKLSYQDEKYLYSNQRPPVCYLNEPLILLIFFPKFLSMELTPGLTARRRIKAFRSSAELLSPELDQARLRLLNSSYISSFQDIKIFYPDSAKNADENPSLASAKIVPESLLDMDSPSLAFILGCGEWTSPKRAEILSVADKFSAKLNVLPEEKVTYEILQAKMQPPKRRRRAVESNLEQTWTTEVTPETITAEIATTTRLPSTGRTRTKTTKLRTKAPSTGATRSSSFSSSSSSRSGTRKHSPTSTTRRISATTAPETRKTLTTAAPTSKSTKKLTTALTSSTGPKFKFAIGDFTCYKGIVCEKEIGKYIVYDKEDGAADRLDLKLITVTSPKISRIKDWLTYNATGTKLVGLPMEVGAWNFRLVASDSAGNRDQRQFEVTVQSKYDDATTDFTHQFILSLNLQYEHFIGDAQKQLLFVQRLSNALDDHNSSHIVLNSIEPGSALIGWSNLTLPVTDCANDQVKYLLRRQQQQSFKDRLGKEFPFKSVILQQFGACGDVTTVELSVTTIVGPKSDDSFFLATILPAIIIFVLLFIAVLVACLLYRRGKQAKKASSIDDSKSEFITKGTPVIFPDEIDVDKESGAAAPMLLKDEKPPLQPAASAIPGLLDFSNVNGANDSLTPMPAGFGGGHVTRNGNQYVPGPGLEHSSPLTATKSTFGGGRRLTPQGGVLSSALDETEMTTRPLLQDFDENPLYRPPPPFEPSRNDARSPRPKHANPQQREPQPYVPP